MKGKILTEKRIINQIIDKCTTCYVGMCDENNTPYVLPFNFGYDGTCIYLHSASEGKKIDILKKNNKVSIAFSTDHVLFHRHEQVACSYGMKFRSVVADGKVTFISDYDKKVEVLNIIMLKYTGKEFTYNAPAVNNVAVYVVHIDSITAKEVGY